MTEQILAHVLDTTARDANARPADDFYRHVNGHWLDTHVIPADRASDGAFHRLRDLSEERCHEIAEDAVAGRITGHDAERIAILHRLFMDEDAVEEAGLAPLRDDLDAIGSARDHAELAALTGTLMRRGVSSFFISWVSTDHADTTRHMTNLGQAGLGPPDESWYREEAHAGAREAWVAHVARVLVLAGHPEEEAGRLAASVMELETRLASHHWDTVTLRDPLRSHNPSTWEQVAASAPDFDWGAWARHVGLDTDAHPEVNVCQPDCLAASAREWARTELPTLKAWLVRKVVDANAPLLSTAFVEEHFDFHSRTLAGTQELRPRWKRSLSLIESCLGEAMGRLWVERHFPASHKERMDALVARLLEAYRASITGLDWMGEATRERALRKLDTFLPKIGHPTRWRDDSTLVLDPDADLVTNVLRVSEWEADREWARLDEPVDREEWFMTPQTVNAYYNPPTNEIAFPAAILQPPFFDPEADDAVNFGAIGAVIGHEIGHGFDDQGSRFDEHGNLVNWWEDSDRERFEERTARLVAQYEGRVPSVLGDHAAEGVHVNGSLTLGENIGDLGGLAIAWKAWCAALAEQGIDSPADAPVIDGLTGPERFFLAWARIWRTAVRPEFAVQLLSIDPHSPAEMRCNLVVRNLDAFHETFGVNEGDGMWLAPAERVSIW